MIKKYVKSFDGIRLLSFFCIYVYHIISNNILYLFVNVFLLLSGILFVPNLLSDKSNDSFFKFLFNYYKKLLKPLLFSFVIILFYLYFFQQNLLKNSISQVLTGVFFINNYWQIYNDISYFDKFQTPLIFTHIWYLSVLFQSAIIAKICINKKYSLNLKIFIALFLSFISMFYMYYLSLNNVSINKIYYDTISRMYPFFLGIVIGLFRLKKIVINNKNNIDLIIILLIFLEVLVYLYSINHIEKIFVWEMQIFTVIFAFILYFVSYECQIYKILSNKLFSFLSKRCYEYYLLSYPITIIVNQYNFEFWIKVFIISVLMIVLAEVYKLNLFNIFMYLFALTIICYYIYNGEYSYRNNENNELENIINKLSVKIEKDNKLNNKKYDYKVDSNFILSDIDLKADNEIEFYKPRYNIITEIFNLKNDNIDEILKEIKLSYNEVKQFKNKKITFIGDSLFVATYDEFSKLFPNMNMIAKVGLQVTKAIELVEEEKNNENIGDIIVICLGLNGPFSFKDYMRLLEFAENKPVYIVNINVKRDYELQNNNMYEKIVKERENTYLIDWKTFSMKHSSVFWQDKVHTNPKGSKILANIVARYILNDINRY